MRRFQFQPPKSWHPTNNIVAQARVAEVDQGRSNQQQSLQLLVSAFYDNFIHRPLKTFGNFYIITKTIIFNPSARIEQKYLIP
jgi:2-methylaconitate cis-trans-isomerase PrpF